MMPHDQRVLQTAWMAVFSDLHAAWLAGMLLLLWMAAACSELHWPQPIGPG